jgi:hypothetical protein
MCGIVVMKLTIDDYPAQLQVLVDLVGAVRHNDAPERAERARIRWTELRPIWFAKSIDAISIATELCHRRMRQRFDSFGERLLPLYQFGYRGMGYLLLNGFLRCFAFCSHMLRNCSFSFKLCSKLRIKENMSSSQLMTVTSLPC